MHHLILLGDSILDNAAYTDGGPAVINHMQHRVATDHRLKVIDLRSVCTLPGDYANPIEPSASGGAKIARAIVLAVTEPAHTMRGANVVGA